MVSSLKIQNISLLVADLFRTPEGICLIGVKQNWEGSQLWWVYACLDTPCFKKLFLIFALCLLKRIQSVWMVLPTYWSLQLHSNKYFTSVESQSNKVLMENISFVLVLHIVDTLLLMLSQHLHLVLLHLKLPLSLLGISQMFNRVWLRNSLGANLLFNVLALRYMIEGLDGIRHCNKGSLLNTCQCFFKIRFILLCSKLNVVINDQRKLSFFLEESNFLGRRHSFCVRLPTFCMAFWMSLVGLFSRIRLCWTKSSFFLTISPDAAELSIWDVPQPFFVMTAFEI